MYQWVKVLHVLAVISWMAGLLYLPRLFVYHSEQSTKIDLCNVFRVMEYRLLRYIMNPAMIVAWCSGLWLAWYGGFFASGWFHAKLALVIVMSGVHGFLAVERKALADGRSKRGSRFFRVVNEVPTVLMIFIVIAVIVKPF